MFQKKQESEKFEQKNENFEQKKMKSEKFEQENAEKINFSSVLGVSGREFRFLLYITPLDDESFAKIYNKMVENAPIPQVSISKIKQVRQNATKTVEPVYLNVLKKYLTPARYEEGRKHYHTQGVATDGNTYSLRNVRADEVTTITNENLHEYTKH